MGLNLVDKEESREQAGKSSGGHSRASSATRQNILEVAMEEFASKGLSGARVDTIAEKTRTTKRMIYYHFHSKEKLYEAVLHRIYTMFSSSFASMRFDELPPIEAMSRLIEVTFDFDDAHPQFIRLVVNENIHYGVHIKKIGAIKENFKNAIDVLDLIVSRGQREGVFRKEVEALDVHLLIRSLCFFRVSNQYTFGEIFGKDFSHPDIKAKQKKMFVEAVLGYLHNCKSSN